MSDAPAPPPPPFPSAPPPPPSGYVAYEPNNWGAGLTRVKPLATWIAVLLGVSAVASVLSLAASGQVYDAAEDYLRTRDEDQFNDDIAGTVGVGLLTTATSIALAVISIIWLYRVVRNHTALGRRVRWAPGWAIGGWFLPPILYVIPFLILRESWSAADPQSPPGSESWRGGRENPLIWVWFALFALVPVVFMIIGVSQFATIGGDADSVADYYDSNRGLITVQSIVGIAGAVAWFLVVRSLTQRHTELTGEAKAR